MISPSSASHQSQPTSTYTSSTFHQATISLPRFATPPRTILTISQQTRNPSLFHHRSTTTVTAYHMHSYCCKPPYTQQSIRRSLFLTSGCPPPNHHRGDGRTMVQLPQLHLMVSGYDGATLWDVSSVQLPITIAYDVCV
ncbi:hypothetical protein Tco_0630625 [Tanacetum coccineum]